MNEKKCFDLQHQEIFFLFYFMSLWVVMDSVLANVFMGFMKKMTKIVLTRKSDFMQKIC